MTETELLAAGYQPYAHGISTGTRLLQKCVRRGNAKLYFIDVDVFDDLLANPDYRGDGMQPQVQYAQGDRTFRVTFWTHSETLATMEAFFADVYERMNCTPYEDD